MAISTQENRSIRMRRMVLNEVTLSATNQCGTTDYTEFIEIVRRRSAVLV